MAIIMKTGTITDSSIINTGLSSVNHFAIHRSALDSIGVLVGQYTAGIGTHYSYCSSYGDYVKYINHSTVEPTISGGKVTWPGTIGTDANALASGKTYNWIAIGEE